MTFGLGATLQDTVPAGAWIHWEGKVYYGGTQAPVALNADLQNQIEGALYSQGWFDSLNVYHGLASWINIRIDAKAAQGFANLDDARRVIEGAIYNYTAGSDGQPYWAHTELIDIASYPAGYRPERTLPGQPSPLPGNSWVCPSGQQWDWASLGCVPVTYTPTPQPSSVNPIDKLASWLGVTPTQAALFGAVGVIAGLFIVKRVL